MNVLTCWQSVVKKTDHHYQKIEFEKDSEYCDNLWSGAVIWILATEGIHTIQT